MEIARGDVVLITYGEFGRPRPAVVVQADELGTETTTVLVCPITSQISERLPTRPAIEAAEGNGLRTRSQIMTDKLAAVPRERIRQTLGTLDTPTRDRLDRALLIVLGLAR